MLRCRIGADQGGGNIDRIVFAAGQKLDSALHRRLKTPAELGDLRDMDRPAVSIPDAFVKNAFEHKGDSDPARRARRPDTTTSVDRQLEQRVEIAKSIALRLV